MTLNRKPNAWLDKRRRPGSPVPAALAIRIAEAKAGTLDRAALEPFGCYPPGVDWYKQRWAHVLAAGWFEHRNAFIHEVGFMVPSRQWLDGLAKLLHARGVTHVLEVCAGHGTLVRPMAARGIVWDAVDEAPMGPDVRDGDAFVEAELAALEGKVGALFASWLPMDENNDQRLASFGLPLIVVGEPPGGCTGSGGFSESDRYTFNYVDEVVPDWDDPPQWFGIHDVTMITTPAVPVRIDFGCGTPRLVKGAE